MVEGWGARGGAYRGVSGCRFRGASRGSSRVDGGGQGRIEADTGARAQQVRADGSGWERMRAVVVWGHIQADGSGRARFCAVSRVSRQLW